MSDSNTNVEIEDVLSSIRRLVSEDRSGARTAPAADAVPPAPMVEDADPAETATITQFQRRPVQAHDLPDETGAGATADTRIDAAIVALNAETSVPVENGPAATGQPDPAEAATAESEGELVAATELMAGACQRDGASGAQFVLTQDFRIETATPDESGTVDAPFGAPGPDDAALAEDFRRCDQAAVDETPASGEAPPVSMGAVGDDTPEVNRLAGELDADEAVPVGPVPASGRADLSLDELMSGDALLATFGSVGVASMRESAWDSDALVDLAPRAAPRAAPLHPTLEATIADLEMAVAAQSEEFEPDMGEDIGAGPAESDLTGLAEQSEGPQVAGEGRDTERAETGATEAGASVEIPLLAETDAGELAAGGTVDADHRSHLVWEAAEAVAAAQRPTRQHRFQLDAEATPPPVAGYIGISDAFPAEDRELALVAAAESDLSAHPDEGQPLDLNVLGEEYSDLDLVGPAVDLEQTSEETLLGLGDAVLAEGTAFLADVLDEPDQQSAAAPRDGQAEHYLDPIIWSADERSGGSLPEQGEPLAEDTAEAAFEAESSVTVAPLVAIPARRIFIAPRVDLIEAEAPDAAAPTWSVDFLPPQEEVAPSSAEGAPSEGGIAAFEPGAVPDPDDALIQDTADHPLGPSLLDAEAEARALPQSAGLWQIAPTDAPTDAPDDAEVGSALAAMTPEALRALVLELIREELQGPLGERITRNVRKLVRREINRALENRDLD